MLWDLIHDYFVQHIFGGYSNGDYFGGLLGYFIYNDDGSPLGIHLQTDQFMVAIKDTYNDVDGIFGTHYISMGDYLSSTATIITLVIILVLCGLFIKKIVSSVVNLMSR